MVSCFPFGYHYLRDDEYGQIGVKKPFLLEWMRRSKSASPSSNRKECTKIEDVRKKPVDPPNLSMSGVKYNVKYMGCIEVKKSMKEFDFTTRSELAKECINRICEKIGIKNVNKRKKTWKQLNHILAKTPNIEHSKKNVILIITSTFLNLILKDSGELIASHEMSNISFASGGDSETVDFIAYVAKDHYNVRACYVLQCEQGITQKVITAIGQAFELRFKQFIKKVPRTVSIPDRLEKLIFKSSLNNDPDYYNDLPGKVPPDIFPTAFPRSYRRDQRSNSELTNIKEACTTDSSDISRENLFFTSELSGGSSCNPPPLPFRKYSPSLHQQQKYLIHEEWFHGMINRRQSEELVIENGDFLVRESQVTPGQYILTSRQDGVCRHLLLVDPSGNVQTKDKTFKSVSHLINYHSGSKHPIISSNSLIILNHHVPRRPSY
ncbi:SHC-transforming protein 1-like isoform X1 [Centruroides vittatus]|uniref:SHC-transforming protein 1-like isoform X1 n=1 Tax=Centruroides vittatus TaxID=120091 RepID=UPI003510B7AD